MICKCGLRRDHFACTACGMHNGVNNQPCLGCHGFRFTTVPLTTTGPQPELALSPVTIDIAASEPSQPKPQPATHARRARSARG